MKKTFVELAHLDFPLAFGQMVWAGETLQNVPWCKEPFMFSPYCLFVRKNDALYLYFDPAGMTWKTDQAGHYSKEALIKTARGYFAQFGDVVRREPALSRSDLAEFVRIVKEGWTWFDGMWWMVEYYDQHGLPMDDLLALRKDTERFAVGVAHTLRNSFQALAPTVARYVDVLLIEEVLEGRLPSVAELEQRVGKATFAEGKLWRSIEEPLNEYGLDLEVVEPGTKELSGQVAYKGKVTGRVRILKTREEMSSFVDGEILVASTTTPDFLPAMKRAGAIISEHGGAICHAAITGRELHVPCIVGVKAATKSLKDGDLVEVDADKGVVTILDRK